MELFASDVNEEHVGNPYEVMELQFRAIYPGYKNSSQTPKTNTVHVHPNDHPNEIASEVFKVLPGNDFAQELRLEQHGLEGAIRDALQALQEGDTVAAVEEAERILANAIGEESKTP